MIRIGHLKESIEAIIAELKKWEAFADCRIEFAYRPAVKDTEMKAPWLIVTPRGAESGLLTLGGAEKQLTFQVGLDIYLPARQADRATALLDEAFECLFFSDALVVVKCRADKLQWDERCEALRLPSVFWLEEVIG